MKKATCQSKFKCKFDVSVPIHIIENVPCPPKQVNKQRGKTKPLKERKKYSTESNRFAYLFSSLLKKNFLAI